jgi:FkbM family methyltransferase
MFNSSKNILKKIAEKIGFEIRRKQPGSHQIPRSSLYGCLQQALKNGLKPETVIDVGAADGTPPLYEVFPEANHILIEPLEEFTPNLSQLVTQLKKAEYIIAAATSKPGSILINVHPDLVGSSIYKEEEDSNVNGVERIVNAVTLDDICRDRGTKGPYLIKIDTQGSELDVLIGAEEIFQETEFIVLEVSLFEFFKGGSQLDDCIKFMKERGFVVYDIFDLQYRLLDGAMSQVDMAFVRDNSCFRQFQFYATQEQRNQQYERLKNIVK